MICGPAVTLTTVPSLVLLVVALPTNGDRLDGVSLMSSGRGPCDALKLPTNYDRYRVPSNDLRPIILTTWITVRSIVDIDERNGLVVAETELAVQWRDETLSHLRANVTRKEQRDGKLLKCIWKPDLFFEEVDGASESTLLDDLSTVQLSQAEIGGMEIKCRSRKTLKLRCSMAFQYYPADIQLCQFHIRSFSYTRDLLSLKYDRVHDPVNLIVQDHAGYDLLLTNVVPSPGTSLIVQQQYGGTDFKNFSVLTFAILARRKLGSHMMTTYVPSILLVMVTWLCFLLPRSMVEARISVCMTTLLTLTAMFASVRQTSPNVNYYTALDVWMFFCIAKIFAALVTFTGIHWLDRKRELNEKQRQTGGSNMNCRATLKRYQAFERFMGRWGFAIFVALFCTFICVYSSWLLQSSAYLEFHDSEGLVTNSGILRRRWYLNERWRTLKKPEFKANLTPINRVEELCPISYGLYSRYNNGRREMECDLAYFNLGQCDVSCPHPGTQRCYKNACRLCKLGLPVEVTVKGSKSLTCKLNYGHICRESFPRREFEMSCTGGLRCHGETNRCECPEGEEFSYSLWRCTKQSVFGEPCNQTVGCLTGIGRDKTMLHCGEKGVCVCPINAVWSEVSKQCQSPVGRICLSFDNCQGANSYCLNGNLCREWESRYHDWKYGEICDMEFPLTPQEMSLGLVCRTGKYSCEVMHKIYDGHRPKCVSVYGGVCDPTVNRSCEVTTECLPNLDSMNPYHKYTCSCPNGTVAHPHSGEPGHLACLPSHGSYCFNTPVAKGTKSFGNCNRYSGLVCKHNRCVCIEPTLVFDRKLGKCVSPLGGYCGITPMANYTVRCALAAECKPIGKGNLSVCLKRSAKVGLQE